MPDKQCIYRMMISNTYRRLLSGKFEMSGKAFRVYSIGEKKNWQSFAGWVRHGKDCKKENRLEAIVLQTLEIKGHIQSVNRRKRKQEQG